MPAGKQVFISYSHEDDAWRSRLVDALAPGVNTGAIDIWDDRQIAVGQQWPDAIEQQIERANVAVLMVSASFLASEYVVKMELPRLVAAARTGRLTLVWVPVSASLYDLTQLKTFQAAIDPHLPLDSMAPSDASNALVSIARTVVGSQSLTDIGSAMQVVDAVYDELRGPGERDISAMNTGEAVEFVDASSTVVEEITPAELATLPDDQHELIQTLEQGMRMEFERWRALRPRKWSPMKAPG